MSVLGHLTRKPHFHGVLSSCNFFSTTKSIDVGSKSFEKFKTLSPHHVPTPTAAAVITYQPYRNAGHSKWANIRHTKTANDQAKSLALTKFMNFMKVAIKEHGSADPKVNSKLAQVIAQVKAAKLPLAPLERHLQALQAKKDNLQLIYPIKGPGSCIMLLDIESSNLNRSKQELATVLRKNNGKVMDESILYMFDHKGILMCSEIDGKAASETLLDDATMHAIDAGASDVEFHKEHPQFGTVLEFITEPSAFLKVKNALEALNYQILHAEVCYLPKQYVELDDKDLEAANKLYNKLTEHPDVSNVYANIA